MAAYPIDGTAVSGQATGRATEPATALGRATLHFDIHAAAGIYLGGVHIELTGDDVTECIGGARGLGEAGLTRACRSQVDPRLNYEQALELAMLIARRMTSTPRRLPRPPLVSDEPRRKVPSAG